MYACNSACGFAMLMYMCLWDLLSPEEVLSVSVTRKKQLSPDVIFDVFLIYCICCCVRHVLPSVSCLQIWRKVLTQLRAVGSSGELPVLQFVLHCVSNTSALSACGSVTTDQSAPQAFMWLSSQRTESQ